jgi:hypothetical protein
MFRSFTSFDRDKEKIGRAESSVAPARCGGESCVALFELPLFSPSCLWGGYSTTFVIVNTGTTAVSALLKGQLEECK